MGCVGVYDEDFYGGHAGGWMGGESGRLCWNEEEMVIDVVLAGRGCCNWMVFLFREL